MRLPAFLDKWVLAGVAALAALASLAPAHAGITVLHTFKGGLDGANPSLFSLNPGLSGDSAGNLYGTTKGGGSGCCGGNGTVFRLAPDGAETVLYVFHGSKHGVHPEAGVTRDGTGNFYGTAGGGKFAEGVVFKLAPDGTESVLHSFNPYSDGVHPNGVIPDEAGNLYGTTTTCGIRCDKDMCCGAVFKLAPDGTETVLHLFTGGSDGSEPEAGLIRDKSGNLYGTTAGDGAGGCCGCCGTVFKVAADGTETVLHAFRGGSDGESPQASLIEDAADNLYGTTAQGGGAGCEGNGEEGCGTVFRLAPDGTETVLYAFRGGSDGAVPLAGLVQDKAGNLFGTTSEGGGGPCQGFDTGCGTVFKLAPNDTETVLYAFGKHKRDGIVPTGLMNGGDGQLYGAAAFGGVGCGRLGCGTVFRVKSEYTQAYPLHH